jgi:rRNA processing protein Gar1
MISHAYFSLLTFNKTEKLIIVTMMIMMMMIRRKKRKRRRRKRRRRKRKFHPTIMHYEDSSRE